jgi:hypothetical protein
VSAADPRIVLPDPPSETTSEAEQDARLVRQMLALTPTQRLVTLQRWAALAATGRAGTAPR